MPSSIGRPSAQGIRPMSTTRILSSDISNVQRDLNKVVQRKNLP